MVSLLLALLVGQVHTVHILDDREHLLNTFIPDRTLGACLDGHDEGETSMIFQPHNLAKMRSAGLHGISLRLRTELAIDAWHWNASGRFSAGAEGYWTSSQSGPIRFSHGYRLPRRGSTSDEASQDGYSRIDDGDPATFWKSNPYLASPFTHESDAKHPQQVVIDLGKPRPVNEIRIEWGNRWAADYSVEYWPGENDVGESNGNWAAFTGGTIRDGHGGTVDLRLCEAALDVRFIRIRMTRSGGSDLRPSEDIRDRLGFAIRELSLGLNSQGRFQDWIVHAKSASQTRIFVSSTDPWHRESDRDAGVEEPGFDLLKESGVLTGKPLLVAVPTLYGTPSDAAGLVRYLRRRGIPIRGIELGEEPDGQFVSPEDYGALYVQTAEAVRRIDRRVPLGGPSFEDIQVDVLDYPHAPGKTWMRRFVDYLRLRGKLGLFQFCSFEWYPYDTIDRPAWQQLRGMRLLLESAVSRLSLPRGLPMLISEYGWSAFAAEPEVDLDGALMDADIVGSFLSMGGRAAYLYGYEPASLAIEKSPNGWGDNMLFMSDAGRRATYATARFWGAQLLAKRWAYPSSRPVMLYAARTDNSLRAYPLKLPDGKWSILLINEDPARAASIKLDLPHATGFEGWQFGRDQYRWHPDGPKGRPDLSQPPKHFLTEAALVLPPYSMTVLRSR